MIPSYLRGRDRATVGEIVESGTHEELLELGGQYKRLHDAQFEEPD